MADRTKCKDQLSHFSKSKGVSERSIMFSVWPVSLCKVRSSHLLAAGSQFPLGAGVILRHL